MANIKPEIWNTPSAQQFAQTLAAISEPEAMQRLLRDVMTEAEIIEISSRLEAARLLNEGAKYIEITRATKLSSRTIARIRDWMNNGTGGYASALANISHHGPSTETGEA